MTWQVGSEEAGQVAFTHWAAWPPTGHSVRLNWSHGPLAGGVTSTSAVVGLVGEPSTAGDLQRAKRGGEDGAQAPDTIQHGRPANQADHW